MSYLKNNKIKYKACLVARGFEEDNLSSVSKDSPTCFKDNFRLTLNIIIFNKWIIYFVDVKSVFGLPIRKRD